MVSDNAMTKVRDLVYDVLGEQLDGSEGMTPDELRDEIEHCIAGWEEDSE